VNTTSIINEPPEPASDAADVCETAEVRAQRRWFAERQSHDPPTPPSAEPQEEALADISYQLIAALTAAKDQSDPMWPAYILAHYDRVCDVYACAGSICWPSSSMN
jgi:hypothetical protein